LATSACSRARSSGSPGEVPGSLPVFFMGYGPAERESVQFHTRTRRFPPRHLSTEFVHNHVDREDWRGQSASASKGLRRGARDFASAQHARVPQASVPFNCAAVTRLRPLSLLR
jgi:hypothetical protein